MSGEDWRDVAMTLSTATPSLVATSPRLEPLTIRLASTSPTGSFADTRLSLSRRQKALASGRGGISRESLQQAEEFSRSVADALEGAPPIPSSAAAGRAGGFGAVYEQLGIAARADLGLNKLANELQILDLNCPPSQLHRLRVSQPKPTEEGLSVVYRLANRTSLPSRSDRQLIQIASLPIDAEFYRVASPALTSYVYEEARLTNRSERVLLAGPAATFLGDRFVGRGQVPSVAIGESFTVGLGIDESLRVERELPNKRERVEGGNRVLEFDYRIAIENFGSAATRVRVYDRLPRSQGADIRVELLRSDPERTETDEHAARRKEGILRWDVEVPAGAIGHESAEVTYTMLIEHDKNLSIVGM